jgi:hypothetical protein
MKQREHEALGDLAAKGILNRPRRRERPRQRAKLPKHANEATCVFTFFAIAATGRIGEKNPHFSADIDQNGPLQ